MLATELRQYQKGSIHGAAKFFYYKCLDYQDKIGDGFILCRGFTDFPHTEHHYDEYQREDNSEIVKIDLEQDTKLFELLQQAVGEILTDMSTLQKAQILAELTADRIGGVACEEEVADIYWSISRGQEGFVFLLGNLSVGQSIHRAVLFKFLSDSLGILVKIVQANSGTLVYLWEHDTEYTINLMERPGFIQGPVIQESGVVQSSSESSSGNLLGGSPRRLNPINYLRKKLQRVKSNDIPQSVPKYKNYFSDLDVESGFVLVGKNQTQKVDSTQKYNEIQKRGSSINESRRNSISSSCTLGAGIPGSQPESCQNTICGTSYDTQASDTDLRYMSQDGTQHSGKNFLGLDPVSFSHLVSKILRKDEATKTGDVRDSCVKQMQAESSCTDLRQTLEDDTVEYLQDCDHVWQFSNGFTTTNDWHYTNNQKLQDESSAVDLRQTLNDDTDFYETFQGFDLPWQFPEEVTAALECPAFNVQQLPGSNDHLIQTPNEVAATPYGYDSNDDKLQGSDMQFIQQELPMTNSDNHFATSSSAVAQTARSIFGSRYGKPGEWNSWIIPRNKIHILQRLGHGSYGKVSLGKRCDTYVAVKEMRDDDIRFAADENSQKRAKEKFEIDFNRETQILIQTAHENIVTFFGVDPDTKCIITEYVRHGSVYNLLHQRGGNQHLRNLIRNNLGVRLEILAQIARALKYLHEKQIWHLDLKTQNLLVGESYNRIHTKVCDFGLSRIKPLRSFNSQGS
eukprot:TRINITY_DN18621_c0_g1_i3.p1 TRINITY_DN18621_c0_g1~~TRINITY_DN18621_c0_g1_i3.p1  ORF type:complete len:739 (-),score=64.42 TRINITY_DN18621_c0_g1_i3:1927-4143(-)